MSLKRRIALNLSIAFSLIFGIMMFVVYVSFNDFRRDEFKLRFQKRLVFTVNFIEKSRDFEKEAPIFFDENSDNVLLNENIMIFSDAKKLIYSTLKDKSVSWDKALLHQLDKERTVYNEFSVPEIYAALRNINGENYYILTSAQDITGQSKLDFLKYMLIFSYVVSILLIWFFSYYIVSKFLQPLEILKSDISEISAHKLTTPVVIKNPKDEIGVLATSFNLMTNRLNDVFQSQKDFNSSAAHEMRTPLTVLRTRLELMDDGVQKDKLVGDVRRLTRLVNQLLTLMSIGNRRDITGFTDLVATARKVMSDLAPLADAGQVSLMLDVQVAALEIPGDATLIGSAIRNLVDNAISFAPPGSAVRIGIAADGTVTVRDHGAGLGEVDPTSLFEPFVRPVTNRRGYGLGLAIVHAIVRLHGGHVAAANADDGGAVFTATFGA